ncbi:hydroxyethylthiazole kinase [Flavobacterium sp. DG1-102-2]|uniref:hydroxyethylthiazole kinase n=1 Tax=Flavobacterium sp. DG1-102-2 TaxID=3081663 RepID=UPI00294A5651|nr:hydroxyethylthiazole kinase [Flavobacterium sp. DG1-102-2]MDV6168785.1 hydroxyethylthiazole kinase [Flavobacterium sp. DG1-102-2]
MKEFLWNSVLSVRKNAPLVHNITNYVVMNTTANALLAVGASPIMAHAHPEVEDMVSICGALVINIGTLDEYWVASMLKAAAKAHQLGKPWVLDPVGAGATAYRNETVAQLLAYKPIVIKGNASEIMALAKVSQSVTKGVDSVHQSTEAIDAARMLNETIGSVVCVSGATDVIVSGDKTIMIHNGHAMMQQVTGLGCTASALSGAFAAIGEDRLQSTAAAMAMLGIAGEMAQRKSTGPGSLQLHILDMLYSLTEEEFNDTLKIEYHG